MSKLEKIVERIIKAHKDAGLAKVRASKAYWTTTDGKCLTVKDGFHYRRCGETLQFSDPELAREVLPHVNGT